MQALEKRFTEADRRAVNESVRAAEAKTSAEIVPVIAGSSGRYDRPEDIVGVWTALLFLVIAWFLYPLPEAQPGDWTAPAPIWQLVCLLAAVLVGFVLGTILGHSFDALRRLFTPRQQMQDEVAARARAVFFDRRVHHTEGASGILLYVSLFEHMAAVVADEVALRHIGQERIDELCAELTQELRQHSPTDALCATVVRMGEILAPLLPRAADDQNELPDALLLLSGPD